MTTTVRPSRQRQPRQRGGAGCRPGIVLHNVSWELYERLVAELAEEHVSINFNDGEMELMPPLHVHEQWKKVIGGFVEILAIELNIPMRRLGQATFRRQDLAKGLEADECYYVQNEAKVRGKLTIDLSHDPPPDLAIEIDVTHSSLDRQAIYAGLGVPEVWQFNRKKLTFLRLGSKGYKRIRRSAAFPFLASSEMNRFVDRWGTMDETTLYRGFRDWVREKFARS